MTITPQLACTAIGLALAFFMLGGYGLLCILQAGDERKKKIRLDELDRERRMDEQPEDVTLVDENLPRALHRVKELKFRWQVCGHATYQFDPERGECLQCVLEGRVASRDMGRR
jgi:hypothetical protein